MKELEEEEEEEEEEEKKGPFIALLTFKTISFAPNKALYCGTSDELKF